MAVALPSYTIKNTKKHTWDSSKHTTLSSLPLNTFTPIPTSLNQTHVQYSQLKQKILKTM
jgi:hypothetical protein